MFYTEIDKNGNIVLSQVVDASNLDGFILSNPDNRIVPDNPPDPPEYDSETEYAERQEPVLGNKVEYVIRNIPGAVKKEPDPKIATDLVIAKQFAQSKNITGPVQYVLTNYNANTQQDIANLFSAESKFLIKVANNQVSEYYESNVEVDGVQYTLISKDAQTNDVIDKYVTVAGGLDMFTADTTAEPVRITSGGYDTIPDRLKPLLDNFEYKNSIQLWSVKSYGFIVEYNK